ncbi:MAG: hypothetical protein Ta2B_12780 [Termitinemataceae bacterium]|nr:MAG: hypothetical protein Ta2B_12780 [Termitinemataceae bacterium]
MINIFHIQATFVKGTVRLGSNSKFEKIWQNRSIERENGSSKMENMEKNSV